MSSYDVGFSWEAADGPRSIESTCPVETRSASGWRLVGQ